MHFSSHLLNEAAVAACWTLVHSLWQGLLLVILTGLVIVTTRRSRPVVRYRLLSVLMVLFTTVAAVTFAREWNAALVQRVAAQAPNQAAGQAQAPGQAAGPGQPLKQVREIAQAPVAGAADGIVPAAGGVGAAADGNISMGIPERVGVFLSEHALLIVAIWLVILGVRLGRMCWALAYTKHIRRHQSQALPEHWIVRLNEMSGRMGFRRPVLLLESAVMKIPVVFGHLKPVIFIPLGLFSQLSPEQAEAILLHELAHIKRNDYLMNLLQSMTVHLFFFNPAVLWLSALLREEREHCCDEMAIAGSGDKKPLVRALIGFRELSLGSGAVYGMGFTGRRNVFVNRITRIVQNKSKGLTAGEGVFFAFSVLLVGFLAMAFKQGGRQELGVRPGVAVVSGLAEWHEWVVADDTLALPQKDSVPRKGGGGSGKGDGWSSKGDGWSERDRLVSLDVDLAHGKQVIVAWYEGRLYHITQVNGVVTNLSVGDQAVPADELGGYRNTVQRLFERLDRVKVDNEDQQLELAKELADQSASQALVNSDLAKRFGDLQNLQQDTLWQNDREAMEKAFKDQELNLERAQKVFSQQQRDGFIQEQQNLQRLQKELQRDNTEIQAIMEELVKRGIVDDVKQIHSLSLTKDAFIVNGKKQPAAVHEAFIKQFAPDPEKDFHYEFSNK